jgi:hypothetical protein
MAEVKPGTAEWDDLREEIVALEVAATEHTNAARDALLEQGDLFQQIAPKGTTKAHNGTGKLLEQMARECGIAPNTARFRRDLSAQVELRYVSQFRQLLTGAADVIISWETLRTILHDDQPEALLSRLIEDARAAGATRISRDDVRRSRGMVTGTVGTPEATAERMARDPQFAKAVISDPGTQQTTAEILAATDTGMDAVLTAWSQRPEQKDRRRSVKERQAERQEEQDGEEVYLFRTGTFFGQLIGLEALIREVTTEGDGRSFDRDPEAIQAANLLAAALRSMADRIEAWANNDIKDPWDRELARMLGEEGLK